MNYLCFILFLLLFGVNQLYGQHQQGSDQLQKQIYELRLMYNTMQAENQSLKTQMRVKDSMAYVEMRREIFEAFNHVSKINFDFLNTSGKIAVTGLFTKLLQANNPTSDVLGFRFSETIITASEKCFRGELKTESERLRFGQMITKLVNNPVVSSIANSNPITSVTAAIISSVAGFSTTTLSVEKNGNKIKDVSAQTTDAFGQKNIEAFKAELQPYIQFYDALNIASNKYLFNIEQVKNKYTYLRNNVETYKYQLSSSLQINDSNMLIRLASLLPDPATKNIDFYKYLKDPRVVQCAGIAGKLPVLEQSVKDFQKEYNQILLAFLNDYVTALQSASKLPAVSVDHLKINALISDIQLFINKEIQTENPKSV